MGLDLVLPIKTAVSFNSVTNFAINKVVSVVHEGVGSLCRTNIFIVSFLHTPHSKHFMLKFFSQIS